MECPLCGERFGSKEIVFAHIWTRHIGMTRFTCWCGDHFDYSQDFGDHIEEHGGLPGLLDHIALAALEGKT